MAVRRARTFLIVVTALVVGLSSACVLFVGVQPAEFHIVRGTLTNRSSPERVHDVVSDVRSLAAWDPWPARPGVARTTTFSPTTTGVGAWVQWSSRDGTTRATIVSDTPESVELRDDVDGRIDASQQTFEVGRLSRSTTITWTFSGHNDLLRRVLWPFVNLEGRIGPDMERSLARLVAMLSATP